MEITVSELALLVIFLLMSFFVTISFTIIKVADIRDLVIEHGATIPKIKGMVTKLATVLVATAFTVVMCTLTLFVVMLRW